MSYRIEITASTIKELAGKLSDLAAQFQATHVVAARPLLPEETGMTSIDPPTKLEPEQKAKKAEPEQKAKKAETKADDTPANLDKAPAEDETKALDYKTDVMPKVLDAVANHGREKVENVLSRFGVPKASQLKPEQFAEFLSEIAALGK